MNNFTAATMVSWESRNWRHRDKAALWCRDYGLVPILKNVYAGKLYAKERANLTKKLNGLFSKKTERFFVATICRTCFESSTFSGTLEKDMAKSMDEGPAFEMIQIAPVDYDGPKSQ